MKANFIYRTMNFFTILNLGNLFISKELSEKEFLAITRGTEKTSQTVRWSCEPIILPTRHLKCPAEVQLNSWSKTLASDQ